MILNKKICILIVAVLSISMLLVGCGKSLDTSYKKENKEEMKADNNTNDTKSASEFNPSDYPLAVMMPVKGHPVHRIVQLGFLEKAESLGYPAEVVGTDGADMAEFFASGEAAASKGIKGMLVWNDTQAKAFVDKMHSKGIKIVIPHFKINKEEMPSLDANLAASSEEYGETVAKVMGAKFKGQKGTVAITQGSFNETENGAAKSFKKYMNDNFPEIKVLDPIEEGFDAPKAIAAAVAIIQSNTDLLGAFGTTGGSPSTWAEAIKQTGKTELIAIGMDYTEQNIDLVKNGKIYAIVAQPLYEEASRSAEILDKLLRGEEVPYFTSLTAPVVTKDTIDEYADIVQRVKDWFE